MGRQLIIVDVQFGVLKGKKLFEGGVGRLGC